jgi:hypothetical protein
VWQEKKLKFDPRLEITNWPLGFLYPFSHMEVNSMQIGILIV